MKKILVCGDAMLDRYWFGNTTRISPEAPVPVISMDMERYDQRLGAAANVSENLRAMGVEHKTLYSPSFVEFGHSVRKLRVIVDGKQMCRYDWDHPQEPLRSPQVMLAAADCDTVVLCDYGKGTLVNITSIIWALKRGGKTVFVDPKSRKFQNYAGVDLLKPNVNELRGMIGGWDSEEELEHKVKALQRKAAIPAVLLTRGAAGMSLYNSKITHLAPAETCAPVDVCGAGDTAMAAFAAAHARGYTFEASAEVANRAAGVSVTRFGTTVVTEAEAFG